MKTLIKTIKKQSLILGKDILQDAEIGKEVIVVISKGEIVIRPTKKRSPLWNVVGIMKVGGNAVKDAERIFDE